MEKENQNQNLKIMIQKKKKVLLIILLIIMLVILALCLWRINSGYEKKYGDMEAFLTAELDDADFPYLSNSSDEQLQEIAAIATTVLDKFAGTDADRESMIQSVKDAILDLGLEIGEADVTELAEWLVDLYLDNYETYHEFSQSDTSGNLNPSLDQIQSDLKSMAEYLEQLDASVTNNKTELEQLINQNGNYDDLKEYLENLTATVTELQENLSSVNSEQLANINNLLGSVYESIASTQNDILVQLANSEISNQEKYDFIQKSLSEMTSSVITEVEEVNDSVSNVLNSLLSDNDENTSSIIKNLQESQKTLTEFLEELGNTNVEQLAQMEENNISRYQAVVEQLNSMQNEIKNVLEEMQTESSEQNAELMNTLETVYEQIDATLSSMEQNNAARYQSLSDDLQKVYGGLSDILETIRQENLEQYNSLMEEIQNTKDSLTDVLEIIQSDLDSKVSELMANLNNIHSDISASQDDIKQFLTDMSSADAEDMDDIIARFTEITVKLGNISSSMDSAHEDIKVLIAELKEGADANQTELLETLNKMDASFSEQNNQNFQKLLQSLKDQSTNIENMFDGLNTSITNNQTELIDKVQNVATDLGDKVNNVTIGITGNQAEVLERLSQMETNTNDKLSALQSDVQSVFQRVSNGKSLLASALLTKNVVVDEDATFQEIHDAILAINQQIVIGVEQIPGKIEYEYHYHTGDSVNGGGCYTVEDVHQHTGSCYVTCTVVESGCRSEGNYNENGMMHCPKTITHSYCWNGETRWGEWVHPDDGNSHVNGDRRSTHLVTVCGKNAGQSYGWRTGCGLQDGQIIGAHIIYDKDAVSTLASFDYLDVMETKDYPPTPMPDNIYPGKTETEMETESGTEVETETTTEEGTETETEMETESGAESESEMESETGTESEVETKPETETESETGAKPETESEAETENSPEIGTETETEKDIESETESEVEVSPENEPDTGASEEVPETQMKEAA